MQGLHVVFYARIFFHTLHVSSSSSTSSSVSTAENQLELSAHELFAASTHKHPHFTFKFIHTMCVRRGGKERKCEVEIKFIAPKELVDTHKKEEEEKKRANENCDE